MPLCSTDTGTTSFLFQIISQYDYKIGISSSPSFDTLTYNVTAENMLKMSWNMISKKNGNPSGPYRDWKKTNVLQLFLFNLVLFFCFLTSTLSDVHHIHRCMQDS